VHSIFACSCAIVSLGLQATLETIVEHVLEVWVKRDEFVPFPEVAPGLGQRSDASLGPVADVSKPRVLPV